jgi:hypothetical protein
MTTLLLVYCPALLVLAGVLLEASRRYAKMRLDQRFCQLSRQAML